MPSFSLKGEEIPICFLFLKTRLNSNTFQLGEIPASQVLPNQATSLSGRHFTGTTKHLPSTLFSSLWFSSKGAIHIHILNNVLLFYRFPNNVSVAFSCGFYFGFWGGDFISNLNSLCTEYSIVKPSHTQRRSPEWLPLSGNDFEVEEERCGGRGLAPICKPYSTLSFKAFPIPGEAFLSLR